MKRNIAVLPLLLIVYFQDLSLSFLFVEVQSGTLIYDQSEWCIENLQLLWWWQFDDDDDDDGGDDGSDDGGGDHDGDDGGHKDGSASIYVNNDGDILLETLAMLIQQCQSELTVIFMMVIVL